MASDPYTSERLIEKLRAMAKNVNFYGVKTVAMLEAAATRLAQVEHNDSELAGCQCRECAYGAGLLDGLSRRDARIEYEVADEVADFIEDMGESPASDWADLIRQKFSSTRIAPQQEKKT